MFQPTKTSRRLRGRQGSKQSGTSLLNSLLDLDRKMMELSMALYSVSPRQRTIMRSHSGRLRNALRRRELRLNNLGASGA